MNSKFGNLAKPAPLIWRREAALKAAQLVLKLSDTGGSEAADVRPCQKPNFEFVSVYDARDLFLQNGISLKEGATLRL
jgi:hypothetical protein